MSDQPKRPSDVNKRAAQIVADATAEPVPTEREVIDALDELEATARAAGDLTGIANVETVRAWVLADRPDSAAAIGRKGGRRGGKMRAASLTPDERSAIAKKAAKARWSPE